MRLALNLGYWDSGPPGAVMQGHVELAQEAERVGYHSVWAAEAYGSDAVTVLTWVAARTTRIEVGSAVLQIPARSPAMTAMTAATLDTLSGGRFRLGLGVSGPQVSEGWHGVRFDPPLARTREYVDIVRMALGRQVVQYPGRYYPLPLPDGQGKALRMSIRPVRDPVPIYLGAVGPRNLELTAEIADGWLAIFFSPEHSDGMLHRLAVGAQRAGRGTATAPLAGFDIVPTVPVVVHDDVSLAADALRRQCAFYIGAMGSRERNFYHDLACRMGFEKEADEIREHFLGLDPRAAAAAVPFEFIDATALIGSPARIRDRIVRYAEAGVTTVSAGLVGRSVDERRMVLRLLADLADQAGVLT
jgi:F420-dependent oxidoreductase-like protein